MAFFYAHIQAKLFSRLESCISRVESTINDIRLSNLPKIIEKGLEGKLHTCPEL